MARRDRDERGRWRHVPAALLAAAFLFPLVFMVTGSLRKAGLPPPRTPELVPAEVDLDNYRRAFELVDLARYTFNSALVVALAVPLTLLVASWAGFAMARLPRRPAGALVALSLVALMVPVTALLVPRFAIFRALGLTDTYVPLVAPALIGMRPSTSCSSTGASGASPPTCTRPAGSKASPRSWSGDESRCRSCGRSPSRSRCSRRCSPGATSWTR